MSGCHKPFQDSGNSHPCIECKLPHGECECAWGGVRTLYNVFSDLYCKLEDRIIKLENKE